MRGRAVSLPSGTRGRVYNFGGNRGGNSQRSMLSSFYGVDL